MTPIFIREWVKLIREEGFKGFIRKNGWKTVAAIFLYYLIRDTILYIIVPVFIFNNVI